MKKNLSIMFVTLLCLSLLLSACGSAPAASKAPAAAAPTKAPAAAAPTKEPAAVEPTKEPAAVEPSTAPAETGAAFKFTAMPGGSNLSSEELASVNNDLLPKILSETNTQASELAGMEAYSLPTDTTWDSVLGAYSAQVQGNSNLPDVVVKDIETMKVAVYGNIQAKVNGPMVAFAPVSDKVIIFEIYPKESAQASTGAESTQAPADSKALLGSWKSDVGDMSFSFTEDGNVVAQNAGQEVKGAFNYDGATLNIQLVGANQQSYKVEISGDKMTWTDDSGSQSFTKVQ
ncbi:MAG: DUF5640 domain-containing protein [Chloroflexi bacterium]|nr:DUF5640 domain-containing protein [Chloroflexota bacterium]